MDLWVVAAAAGAGYVAKNLQNLPSSEKQRLVESSSKFSSHTSQESRNFLQQIRDKTCPLRRLARERALREASDEKKDGRRRRILDMEQLGGSSADSLSEPKIVSTSGRSEGAEEDYNVLWLSSSPPGFSGRESTLHSMEFVDTEGSPFELDKFKLLKNRTSGYFVKPFSLQGLAPQIHKEHQKVEEYIYGSVPSPCISTMRPPLILDGTQTIGGPTRIPTDIWTEGSKDTIDPSLGMTDSLDLHGTASGSPNKESGKASYSPGTTNFMLFLMIGINIGIISATMVNQKEVASLNEQLKQTDKLVQDLEEELEMKDKLTVKDLAYEDSQSIKDNHLSNQELLASVQKPQYNKPEASEIDSYGVKKGKDGTTEDLLLRSEVEAELEAELERLGLNLKTAAMYPASGFTELDLELEADTIQEGMKGNPLSRRQFRTDSWEADNEEESGNSSERTPPPNYAVSPRELSIRLHELMESRLEVRIKELEIALQNNQTRLQFLESECTVSQDTASTSESTTSIHQ